MNPLEMIASVGIDLFQSGKLAIGAGILILVLCFFAYRSWGLAGALLSFLALGGIFIMAMVFFSD